MFFNTPNQRNRKNLYRKRKKRPFPKRGKTRGPFMQKKNVYLHLYFIWSAPFGETPTKTLRKKKEFRILGLKSIPKKFCKKVVCLYYLTTLLHFCIFLILPFPMFVTICSFKKQKKHVLQNQSSLPSFSSVLF